MKRVFCIAFVMFFVLGTACDSLAAGKATITQENFYVVNSWGVYGYAFARIENTGNKPIAYNAGLLEVYDKNGDAVGATTYLKCYGSYLQPGEYVYLSAAASLDTIKSSSEVDDYSLTVSGQSNNSMYIRKFSCDTEYKPNEKSGYWNYNHIYATFTNDTDDVVYGVAVVMALLDKDDNILDIETVNISDSVGIWPGCKLTVVANVSDLMIEAYKGCGFTADHVDAYAYVELIKQ